MNKDLPWKQWEVRITPHGPALFDDNMDCHGAVSISKNYKKNISVQNYCNKIAQDSNHNIMINIDPLKELKIGVRLDEIYMCERKN